MVKHLKKRLKKLNNLERASLSLTNWVGTPESIILHTLFFIGIFALGLFGFALDQILLILTTAVSLEAIYLAIFIQMTVNRNTKSLEEVEADIDEIQEDVEELEEDVEDITEDIEEDEVDDKETKQTLTKIDKQLQLLLSEISNLKTNIKNNDQKNI